MRTARENVKADVILHDGTSIGGTVLALDKTTPLASVVVQANRRDTNGISGRNLLPDRSTASATPPRKLEIAPLQPGLMGEYFQPEQNVSDFLDAGMLGLATLRRVDHGINFDEETPEALAGTELAQNFYVR